MKTQSAINKISNHLFKVDKKHKDLKETTMSQKDALIKIIDLTESLANSVKIIKLEQIEDRERLEHELRLQKIINKSLQDQIDSISVGLESYERTRINRQND